MKVTQSYPTLCDTMDYPVHGILQARILQWVAFPFSRGSSQPRDKPRSPALQADSLPDALQGKLKNTGVGSLSLLHWIFPTQELNRGLQHCRWILCHLSYYGSEQMSNNMLQSIWYSTKYFHCSKNLYFLPANSPHPPQLLATTDFFYCLSSCCCSVTQS